MFCIGTEMTTTGEIPSSTSVLQHHKKYHQQCILTLCAGLKKRSVVLYMSILSIVTPIGVLIGIIVTVHMEQVGWSFTIQQTTIRFYQDRAKHRNRFFCLCVFSFNRNVAQAGGAHVLAIGVLQGLAAGTLLYITFYEVSLQYIFRPICSITFYEISLETVTELISVH